VDKARQLIERLDRIEELKRTGAPAALLLDEVRRLLREGEDWLAAERAGNAGSGSHDLAGELERAGDALARGRAALGIEDTVGEVIA
jgi:hypothetical protein